MKGSISFLIFISLKGVKISETQDLPSEFDNRLDNTQIISRIECEMILKYRATDMDDTACCDK